MDNLNNSATNPMHAVLRRLKEARALSSDGWSDYYRQELESIVAAAIEELGPLHMVTVHARITLASETGSFEQLEQLLAEATNDGGNVTREARVRGALAKALIGNGRHVEARTQAMWLLDAAANYGDEFTSDAELDQFREQWTRSAYKLLHAIGS